MLVCTLDRQTNKTTVNSQVQEFKHYIYNGIRYNNMHKLIAVLWTEDCKCVN